MNDDEAANADELRRLKRRRPSPGLTPVEGPMNCGLARGSSPRVRFAYECPNRWETLELTPEPTVRFCGGCREKVFLCDDESAVREHAAQGHCVAVPFLAAIRFSTAQTFAVGRPRLADTMSRHLFPLNDLDRQQD